MSWVQNHKPVGSDLHRRAEELFGAQQRETWVRIDRLFAVVMLLQWVAAIGAAVFVSPYTWAGSQSDVHLHVWLAIVVGFVLAAFPIFLARRFPGHTLTRYVIASAQVLFSALLIHVTGGRMETHFHVFVSLAFLAYYRDWKVLIPATLIVAADHIIRGFYWPESVYGVAMASSWRWMEHAAWVLLEDTFLILGCRRSVQELWQNALWTAELEQSDQDTNAILEASLDAVVRISEDGLITGWNARAEQTFGWTAAEALGQGLAELIIPPQFREAHLKGLKRYQQTGVGKILHQRLELSALHRDGREFPVELVLAPIHSGSRTGFCAFLNDITKRREVAEAMRLAKEAAEASNQAKSEFLANMSHEIRTPLNSILGFTQVLRRGVRSEEERHTHLDTILSSGQHLRTLIDDILDLSKIEAGEMQFEREPCSPHEIISEVLSILRVPAQEKCLRLEARWASGVPEQIETDPLRLRQLLMNLAGNAIKFTAAGGVELVVTVNPSAPEPRFMIEVRDTGIGIAPEQLEHIFAPFVQTDNSVTRRFGGTGLGLTISRHLARALGGDVSVQSQPGVGSTFRVTLATGPLDNVRILSAPPTEALRSSQASEGKQSSAPIAGRVLLVDDGETNRNLISLVLRDLGLEIVSAENGQRALDEASQQEFDLVLMDMQMPVMDGYTATRQLREQGFVRPIIALTANAMRGDAEKCLAAGCSGYLAKPIDIDRLLQTVTAALKPSPSPAVPQLPILCTLPIERPEYRQLAESFIDRLCGKLDEMQAAIAAEDLDAVAELAHWLKGSGGTIGFDCFTDPARRLERLAHERQSELLDQVMSELQNLAGRITVTA